MRRAPKDLEAWRGRIPILRHAIPLANCSQAPQTDATREAAERYLHSWNAAGMDWDTWIEEVELARAAFARLINASPDDIAITSSVSEAASSLASALDFSGTRRRVVLTEAEFPTIGHVWLAQQTRGAQLAWVPLRDGIIHDEDYDALLDDRTLIVSACHAYYLNGYRQDLATLVRKTRDAGALLFVDAYQTLGTMPIDVKALGIDALASGSLKYLMGIPGIAFLYVRREVAERLHPTLTGWFGRAEPFAFRARELTWAPGARRFDTGTPPVINAYVARAGIELIESAGTDVIHEWTTDLSRHLVAEGETRGLHVHGTTDVARKSPLTAFICNDAHALEAALRAHGVIASARGPVIRLAPHFYSSTADVELALDILLELRERQDAAR